MTVDSLELKLINDLRYEKSCLVMDVVDDDGGEFVGSR